mgnify:FL=1
MTFEQKQMIRRNLELKLAALKQDVLDVKMDACADENELASRVSEVDLKLVMNDRRLGWIREIETALKRMEYPDYGICDECGEEIGILRLEARPTTELCIDCQSERERDAAA